MTVFVDTSVVMYTVGGPHPLQASCRRVLDLVSSGAVDATTSVEVVQELLHRYGSLGRHDLAQRTATLTMDMFAPVLPITHAVMRRVPNLMTRYPSLDARDLVHVATCIHEGIADIVSADRGFDQVAEVRRIDPLAFNA